MYKRRNRLMSVTLIITCLLFLLFFFLSQWNPMYYPLRELCHLFVFICSIAIPIETVIGLIIWIKYLKENNKFYLRSSIINLLAVLLTSFCIVFYVYQMNSVTSEGQVKNFELYHYGSNYYVVLNDACIPITEEQYKTIDTTKWYHFAYKFNKLRPNDYTMITFEEDELQ